MYSGNNHVHYETTVNNGTNNNVQNGTFLSVYYPDNGIFIDKEKFDNVTNVDSALGDLDFLNFFKYFSKCIFYLKK